MDILSSIDTISSQNNILQIKKLYNQIKCNYFEYINGNVNGSTEKIRSLERMKGNINSYLEIVQHLHKFKLQIVSTVLNETVQRIDEFDPQDASYAFECLASYSNNLLEQPWRNDFNVIKLTSGFYIHKINRYLVGADRVLEVLGYTPEHQKDYIIKLHAKPEPYVIAMVAIDCYIASQECNILSLILANAQRILPNYPLTVTVYDAFQIRKERVGDASTITKILIQKIRDVPTERLIEFDQLEMEAHHKRPASASSNYLKDLESLSPSLVANKNHIIPVRKDKNETYHAAIETGTVKINSGNTVDFISPSVHNSSKSTQISPSSTRAMSNNTKKMENGLTEKNQKSPSEFNLKTEKCSPNFSGTIVEMPTLLSDTRSYAFHHQDVPKSTSRSKVNVEKVDTNSTLTKYDRTTANYLNQNLSENFNKSFDKDKLRGSKDFQQILPSSKKDNSSSQQLNVWKCDKCGVNNLKSISSSICRHCRTERMGNVQPQNSASSNNLILRETKYDGTQNVIECSQCTLINLASRQKCEVCQNFLSHF